MEMELYCLDGSPSGGDIYLVDDSWSEESVTWNDDPDIDNRIGSFGKVFKNKYARVDISNDRGAQDLLDDGNFQHGLYIRSDNTDGADYGKSGGRKPKLIITYKDGCQGILEDVVLDDELRHINYDQNDLYHCAKSTIYAEEATYIAEKKPNQNFSNEDRIEVDKADGNDGEKRILIRFDVDSIPNKENVVKMEMELYCLDGSPSGGDIYLVDDSWSEESVTWNDDPDIDNRIGSFGKVFKNKYARVDISNDRGAQDLLDDGNFQHGLYIRSDNTDGADYGKSGGRKPKLIITYKDECKCKLNLQADGNLVVYRENKRIWSSGYYGNGDTYDVYTFFLSSGELVTLDDGATNQKLWSSNSGSSENGDYRFVIMDDCRLAIQDVGDDSKEIWTNFLDSLSNGSRLQRKERFVDNDSDLVMVLQGDGNLIICTLENVMGTACTSTEWSAGVKSNSDDTRLLVLDNPARLALFDENDEEYWSLSLSGCELNEFGISLTMDGPVCR